MRICGRCCDTCERLIAGRYPFSRSSSEVPLTEFGAAFRAQGRVRQLFHRAPERSRRHLDSPLELEARSRGSASGACSRRFEDARAIQEVFFEGGAAQPSLRFGVTVAFVDAATTAFALEIDGQKFDNKKPGAVPATWPGQNAGSASATFDDRTGVGSGPHFEGPWAFFRFIDAGQPRQDSDTRTTVTLQGRRGHEAQVVIEAVSLDNPFARREWQRFGCGS